MAGLLDLVPTIAGAGLLLYATDMFLSDKKDETPRDRGLKMAGGMLGLAIGASLLSTLKVDKVV